MRMRTVRQMLKSMGVPEELGDFVFQNMKGIPDEKVKDRESREHKQLIDVLKTVHYRKADNTIEVREDENDEFH